MNKGILYALSLILIGLGLVATPVMAQTPALAAKGIKATGWLLVRYSNGSFHSFSATFEYYGDRYAEYFQLTTGTQTWAWELDVEPNSVSITVGLYMLNTGFGSEGEAWAVIYGNQTMTPPQNPPGGTWIGTKNLKWVMSAGTIHGHAFYFYSSHVLCTEAFSLYP
ncbi:MAG: hypothetical protein ABSG57_01945 [Candidatus Bathyarchaeia archaeon]